MENNIEVTVGKYLEKCKDVINKNDRLKAEELQKNIFAIFSGTIPRMGAGLETGSIGFDKIKEGKKIDYVSNVKNLKEKLELFLAREMNHKRISEPIEYKTPITVNNNNTIQGCGNSANTNTNTQTQNQTVTNTFDIKVELDKVRAEVEADEVLDDGVKEEINERLDEIQEVMSGAATNNEKWKKLKSTFTWIATKSYKVGQWIIPIITKALFPDSE